MTTWLRHAVLAAAVAAGCGAPLEGDPYGDAHDGAADAGYEDDGAPEDAAPDARPDVAPDRPADAGVDRPVDVTADVPRDAPSDARLDAPADARADVTPDARGDASLDARADVTLDADRPDGAVRCPAEMTLVDGRVCVDRWEASLEEVSLDGGVAPWSPYQNPGTRRVRAVSAPGVTPQGYITGAQSQAACAAAGKRLCVLDEWLAACRGPMMRTYPYGFTYVRRRCNEGRTPHPVVQFFGTSTGVFTFENMNNPGINMQPDTVAPTGRFAECVSPWGAYDMVGNLHEWIADPGGTFKGGFYVDAEINGRGCLYTTTAHAFTYRDYSTGFRCCANPSP